MALWPMLTRPRSVLHNPRTTSRPTTVTATAGAANIKGAWAQLVAAVSDDVCLIDLWPTNSAVSGSDTSVLLDLGIGPTAMEVPILSNLACGFNGTFTPTTGPGVNGWRLPIKIPSGARLSARVQSVLAAEAVDIAVDLYGGKGWAGLEAIGVTHTIVPTDSEASSASKGKVLTAGTANTKGAWVELVASSAHAYNGFILGVQPNSRVVTTAESWVIDIGIGPATETVIIPDVPFRYASIEFMLNLVSPTFPLGFSIPAGTRIAARAACTVASVTCDLSLHGMVA